jgi:hypothetical protein
MKVGGGVAPPTYNGPPAILRLTELFAADLKGGGTPWIHRLIMPPAARNPFVKGFLDLPKLFIRYVSLLYLLTLPRSLRGLKKGSEIFCSGFPFF